MSSDKEVARHDAEKMDGIAAATDGPHLHIYAERGHVATDK
jgi:hypothetical protein